MPNVNCGTFADLTAGLPPDESDRWINTIAYRRAVLDLAFDTNSRHDRIVVGADTDWICSNCATDPGAYSDEDLSTSQVVRVLDGEDDAYCGGCGFCGEDYCSCGCVDRCEWCDELGHAWDDHGDVRQCPNCGECFNEHFSSSEFCLGCEENFDEESYDDIYGDWCEDPSELDGTFRDILPSTDRTLINA